MLKFAVGFLLSLFATVPCSLAQSVSPDLDGIWRDTQSNSKYYSFHVEGDAVVMLDLARVEKTASTLSSAYTGKLSDLVLTRVGPAVPAVPDFNGQVALYFTSPTEGFIMPICAVCTVIPTTIRKLF